MMKPLSHISNFLREPLPFLPVNVSPIVLLQAILILVITVILSKLMIRFLKRNIFNKYNIKEGIQDSIAKLIHYVFVVLGIFVALNHIGIDMTALAALGAVLMVGIGFGLQNITSNFISGLIMLFERPIQVGDYVDVGGVFGKVNTINARSTTVTSIDNISIIVPNSQFITESLVNWSHKDPRIRLHVRVGVSYNSDVDIVRNTLLEVGRSHPEVLKDPRPMALFYEFGESSLNFDLLVWTDMPLKKFIITSDLNYAIVHAFRENNIEIPYPQRDLHVRSSVPLK